MSFSKQIANFSKSTQERVQKTRRGVTLKLFAAVVRDTPVDTGALRGNWQLTEGAPATNVVAQKDKNGGTTINNADARLKPTTGDKPIFLTNNLPYASRIEFDGWSHTKAPQGMVRKNVVRFGQLIEIEVKTK